MDDQYGQAVVSGEHTEICTCWHHSVGSLEKQMRANARLIAAAPELLEALSDTLTLARLKWGNLDPAANIVFENARAAIARARGDA